jgi:hypothetical protein
VPETTRVPETLGFATGTAQMVRVPHTEAEDSLFSPAVDLALPSIVRARTESFLLGWAGQDHLFTPPTYSSSPPNTILQNAESNVRRVNNFFHPISLRKFKVLHSLRIFGAPFRRSQIFTFTGNDDGNQRPMKPDENFETPVLVF